jgi:asparagine synthase (glutamine-hydrolysing)
MCGIVGFVTAKPRPDLARKLPALANVLAHRGPDDRGFLTWDAYNSPSAGRALAEPLAARVGLAHRRLSIIDLSEGGWQPMEGSGGRHIIYNGEIYNYREVREELKIRGHRFRTASDTEVLLAAYAEWGVASFRRLVGMFALAILDRGQRRLILARDPFGIKPLFITRWRGGLAFASEVLPLLDLPEVSRKVNAKRLHSYLRYGDADTNVDTFFADVTVLPPAHLLEVPLEAPDAAHPTPYWSLDVATRDDLSLDDAASRLRDLFIESVALHLRSDVPIGACLSGGIDSSAIVMAMREIGGQRLDLHTVSYVADDPALSEERWIDVVGSAARANCHKVKPQPTEIARDLDDLITAQGEPFAGFSIYAQYRVFREAQDAGLKVMLDGQGADELFGGYPSALASRLAGLLAQGRVGEASAFWRAVKALPITTRPALLLRAASQFVPEGLQRPLRSLVGQGGASSWLKRDWFEERCAEAAPVGDDLLKVDLRRGLERASLPTLLRYEDRNSMAFSIESRVPFLTPKLAEFAMSLPSHYLLAPDATSKAVLRQAMRGLVPDVVLDRRDKVGFTPPESRWILYTRGWVDSALNSETLRLMPFIDSAKLLRSWDMIQRGRAPYHPIIWRCANLSKWGGLVKAEMP